jgi:hypothetical protein
MKLVREPGAGSGEREGKKTGSGEWGAGNGERKKKSGEQGLS